MRPRPRLFEKTLRYEGIVLHTATSGPVAGLEAVYLTLDYDGLVAASELRVNIAYLTGVEAERQRRSIREAVAFFPFSAEPEQDRASLDDFDFDPPTRALLEAALVDAAARRRGCPAAVWLGASGGPPAYRTNQTLFRDRPERVLARARAYVERGFRDLKLRIGFGAPEADLGLLRELRRALGPDVHLAADVNGAWSVSQAEALLEPLAALGIDYLEQPIAPGNPEAYVRLARQAAFPLMLDETLRFPAETAYLLESGTPFLWHLKLVKAGGLDRMLETSKTLRAAGHDVMIGQMNEGALATAAALTAAAAIQPPFAELYGADGLLEDPAQGLSYENGRVRTRDAVGIGAHLQGGAIPVNCAEIPL